MQTRPSRDAISLLAAFVSVAATKQASAQEFVDVDTVGTFANVPMDLPGHDYAPRQREHPDAATGDEATAQVDAEQEALPREWFGGAPFWEWSRVLGDLGGVRTAVEDAGLTISASYTVEWTGVWSGGVSNNASRNSLFDVNALLDLDKAFAWRGGSVFVDFYSSDSTGGNEDAGDFQVFSNLETTENVDQIAELWFEQVVLDGAARVKFGKIEANSEFAFLEGAGEFINSSAGFSPTIFALPSYPEPATGVVLQVTPAEAWYLSGGLFDGATAVDGVSTGRNGPRTFFSDRTSDDLFFIGETGVSWSFSRARDGRVAAGIWHHTGDFERFQDEDSEEEPVIEDGTVGFYFVAEQRVWSRHPDDPDSDRGLTLVGQAGWAEEDISAAELHMAGGVVLLGTLAHREDDATGVYVSYVDLSRRGGFVEDETAIELFYRLQLTPAISLKPDLHVITNPSGDPEIDTAVVGTLRLEIVF